MKALLEFLGSRHGLTGGMWNQRGPAWTGDQLFAGVELRWDAEQEIYTGADGRSRDGT